MTDDTNGQPETAGTPPKTTAAAGTEGNVTPEQKTGTTGTVSEEETFFDPESIKGKPELEAAYKDMQRAFTKKTSALKENSKKIEAYDNFMRDPVGQLQALASQYGYSMTKAEAQRVIDQQNNVSEPKSWDDVMSMAEQRVLKRLEPFLSEVKETRKGQLEKMLDESCPDWRVYEDDMMKELQKHPTLVNDPVKLYRMSVPDEVWQSRATQAAIKKLQSKAESALVSGGSNTNKQASDSPRGPMPFSKAVEIAKAKLQAQGIRAPNS